MTIMHYIKAFGRSLKRYSCDGPWKERLQWEIGFAEGILGRPARITSLDHPYGHGYYTATTFAD